MSLTITIPSVGESVREAILAEWYKKDGDRVQKDEPLLVIETDKVTLEIHADVGGILRIKTPEGETVAVGAEVGVIETEAEGRAEAPSARAEAEPAAAPPQAAETRVAPETEPPPPAGPSPSAKESSPGQGPLFSPSVRRMAAEQGIDPFEIRGTGPGGRVTKADLLDFADSRAGQPKPAAEAVPRDEKEPEVTRKAMSPIRKRIADRLLKAKQNTAMLTTFNEIDMNRSMAIREEFKESFKKKYGVSLGFMSFFIKASVEALKEFPAINAYIEGEEILYHHYYHVGIAVGSPRGLVVPVIRNADRLGFAGLEKAIVDYVAKIKENRLELSDLEGGTFTITNGGVFGSLLSTPILNTPQSGILGMHKIEKRPVVVDDQVQVRPMMYVALSYDHRIVDGREAVTFLKRIKECVENPERMLVEI